MQTSIARRGAVQLVTLASAALSAFYYYSQGPDVRLTLHGVEFAPVAIGLGITAFALDAVKPEAARIAGDATAGTTKRWAAAAVFVVLFLASMAAVDGLLMKFRSDIAATRGSAITNHADDKREMKRLEGELAKVQSARTTEQVRASMDKARVPARTWADTKQCTTLADDDDRRLCRPVLDLREEMATAIRKASVEADLTKARAKVVANGTPPKSADPQADTLASWFGVTADTVAYALVAVLGFGIEVVACLGVWLVQRPSVPAQPTFSKPASAQLPTTCPAAAPQANRLAQRSPNSWKSQNFGRPNGSSDPTQLFANGRANRLVGAQASTPTVSKNSSDARLVIEAFVTTELALGRTISAQRDLARRFKVKAPFVSEVLSSMEARGMIRRRNEGRCKVIEAA